eukprot:Nk52_evm44s226 gene=Nk52_evmTU44s226
MRPFADTKKSQSKASALKKKLSRGNSYKAFDDSDHFYDDELIKNEEDEAYSDWHQPSAPPMSSNSSSFNSSTTSNQQSTIPTQNGPAQWNKYNSAAGNQGGSGGLRLSDIGISQTAWKRSPSKTGLYNNSASVGASPSAPPLASPPAQQKRNSPIKTGQLVDVDESWLSRKPGLGSRIGSSPDMFAPRGVCNDSPKSVSSASSTKGNSPAPSYGNAQNNENTRSGGRGLLVKSTSEIPSSPRFNDFSYCSPQNPVRVNHSHESPPASTLFSHITLVKRHVGNSPNGIFGVSLEKMGDCFYVSFVMKDSPAAKANIRVGDEVLSVDRLNLSKGALSKAEDVMKLLNDPVVTTRLFHIRKGSLLRAKKMTKEGNEPLGLVLLDGVVVRIFENSAAHRACFPVDVSLVEVNGKCVIGFSDGETLDWFRSCVESSRRNSTEFRISFMHQDYAKKLFRTFNTAFLNNYVDRSINHDFHIGF